MSSTNPFVWPTERYKRDLNVLAHYVRDTATYLSLMTGKPFEVCRAFVRDNVEPGGRFPLNDPQVVCLERQANGDRTKIETTLSQYLQSSIKDQELIAPTLTTYLNPEVKPSLLVGFIDSNVKGRSKAKKEMFAAKKAGDTFLHAFKKGEQTGRKLSNNAISGAHLSASTPLFNRTAHSTLTSNCRSTSGYGNANNEKFLSGNRHYWDPSIVRNNIVSVLNRTDLQKVQVALDKFGIRRPSVEETMECIEYSTKLYWRSKVETERLLLLVRTLTPLQRAAFVYVGDMYHLAKYNDELMRVFMDRLSTRVTGVTVENPQELLKNSSDDYRSLVVQLCVDKDVQRRAHELDPTNKGVDFDMASKVDPDVVYATLANVTAVLEEYRDLITAFWVTDNVPASLAFFPESIRRSAITSDTDSTIFTVQDWVQWHQGHMGFDQKCNNVAAAAIFLASQTITHVLARMSANFGISKERLYTIAMKNEFKFDVFVATQVAKHYYATISCQEGLVFNEREMEIKGVHLKSSNAPKEINRKAKEMMQFITDEVIAERKLSLEDMLTQVAIVELEVMDSIRHGSFKYFRRGQIKTPSSYSKGEDSTDYQQYLMWSEIFGPKYGMSEVPPYMTVKLSTELDKPAVVAQWIADMKDREMAARVQAWLKKTGKKHLGSSIAVPEQIALVQGLPKELLDAVDVRGIVSNTTKIFYLILETLGFYMLNKKRTRLIVDEYEEIARNAIQRIAREQATSGMGRSDPGNPVDNTGPEVRHQDHQRSTEADQQRDGHSHPA